MNFFLRVGLGKSDWIKIYRVMRGIDLLLRQSVVRLIGNLYRFTQPLLLDCVFDSQWLLHIFHFVPGKLSIDVLSDAT